ncbi:MAG: hypothetical protein IJI67_09745 [Clostridia bacterium]|nr:hypothetical protein [Clostridia bacterium]
MENKRNYTWFNCIATALLAYFFTVPFHEFLHFLTYYAYGDKVAIYSAGAVQGMGLVDIATLPVFHRIMLAGGSASIINALIGIVLFIVLIKAKSLKPLPRLFLTQLMGGQLVQGIGYFMIGGLFGAGDWGGVYAYLNDVPGVRTGLQIALSVIGCGGVVAIFFMLNHLSYYFIEDSSDKKQRRTVGFQLHMTVFIVGFIVGLICSALSPMNATGELNFGLGLLYNCMWIPFFWGFMFTGFMVKPPKQSRFTGKLDADRHIGLWVVSIALILVDICIFGPGIAIH